MSLILVALKKQTTLTLQISETEVPPCPPHGTFIDVYNLAAES